MADTPKPYPFMLRLDPDMKAALEADAAENDRTVAQTIRRACKQYLAREASNG
jgi:predicted transcriptional regulator